MIPAISFNKIFSVEETSILKESIASLPRECFFYEHSNDRWGLSKRQPLSHRYVDPNDSWFDVTFGNECQVVEENITLPYKDYENHQTISKVVSVALKWLAEKMTWRSCTKSLSMSIMQHYHLQKGQTPSGIPWHRDYSDHSLVILLDDETKWSGGDFLFKVEKEEPQIFHPKCGYGVLFSNDGTQHSVKPLTALEDSIDRTILTIHEKL